jgi:hypothetical protein
MTAPRMLHIKTDEDALRAILHIASLASREPSDTLTSNEQAALDAAACDAGAYLHGEVGHFDFAQMSDEQRGEFLRLIIVGYRKHLRAIVETAPPF